MSKGNSGKIVRTGVYRSNLKSASGGGGRRHAILCSVCGATVSTMRLREAEQITALCVACRETMRRLKIAGERDRDPQT